MPIKLTNHPKLRTIRFVASGRLTEEEMDAMLSQGRAMTDSYEGRKHLILADMRGLKVSSAKVAEKLVQLITYQRSHGVHLCVHLSDEAVTRLQIARLTRSVSTTDSATVEVVSLEEAETVLSETRLELNAK